MSCGNNAIIDDKKDLFPYETSVQNNSFNKFTVILGETFYSFNSLLKEDTDDYKNVVNNILLNNKNRLIFKSFESTFDINEYFMCSITSPLMYNSYGAIVIEFKCIKEFEEDIVISGLNFENNLVKITFPININIAYKEDLA